MILLLADVRNEKEVLKIEEEIDTKVRENVNESQKEFYLREKMKVIQEELGDKAKKESDIEEENVEVQVYFGQILESGTI